VISNKIINSAPISNAEKRSVKKGLVGKGWSVKKGLVGKGWSIIKNLLTRGSVKKRVVKKG
jgi:hypothetical protein